MEKLDKLIDINHVDLSQLLYWNQKLKNEINKRIMNTRCPFCMNILKKEELKYCSFCGNKIQWIWED